jgi:RNA polymerase sigma-70 factor (ECF subfamily)
MADGDNRVMAESDLSLGDLQEGRRKFMALVAEIRPELHRYCARMTGSVTDGEDLVQDTLARAYFSLAELDSVPPLRPWLFKIAHHRAIDHLRRYERRMVEPLDGAEESVEGAELAADDALAQEEAMRFAISSFVDLPPLQRSAVILKDVLDHSLEEIAARLEISVLAVKSALFRGRARLAERRADAATRTDAPAPSPTTHRYAALFNARDWDAVRAMLAEDVRLDLVSRHQRAGRRDVGAYFTNYDAASDWYLVPAWLDGREVFAVMADAKATSPSYFVEIRFVAGKIAAIRDYRYARYVAREAPIRVTG